MKSKVLDEIFHYHIDIYKLTKRKNSGSLVSTRKDIGKTVERRRRKAIGPVKWQPAAERITLSAAGAEFFYDWREKE